MASQQHRDRVINRLRALLDIACQGWLENLPERPQGYEEVGSVRRQKLAIHDMRVEADGLLKHYYPPKSGDD